MNQRVEVAICGAGIAGVSAAYFLTLAGLRDVLLIDERPPLTLTSDRSTECYRNWWPDPAMRALMDRSIDLMEGLASDSANVFSMNRRGYLYVTGERANLTVFQREAQRISDAGAGPLRVHSSAGSGYAPSARDGFQDHPSGADLLLGHESIQAAYPYLSKSAIAALHVRRAGWLSAQQLGMHMLDLARQGGARNLSARVTGVETSGGHVTGVILNDNERVDCGLFVNAAGPFFGQVGSMLGLALPVETEVHLKVVFDDSLRVVGREAPLLIWNDPQHLPWRDDERRMFEAEPELAWLTAELPAGAHTRPEGGPEGSSVLMLWDYRTQVIDPEFPVPLDDKYPEIALRGLSSMLPQLEAYVGRATRPQLDGGYYVRTRENRPLVGATPVEGAFVIGALSGYGIMSACGLGELLAATVTEAALPSYAGAFALKRYDDPEYMRQLEEWNAGGEL